MKFTVHDLIKNFELNDCKVTSVQLNTEKFIFEINFEDAYWFKSKDSNEHEIVKNGFIKISNYKSFEARFFETQSKLWHTMDYKNLEQVKEVNEKFYECGVLSLCGFSKDTGNWIEYLINGGEILIEFGK